MSLVLTPIYTDHFTPNANPADPTKWTPCDTFASIESLNGNAVQPTIGALTSAAQCIGASFPNDSYASATIGEMNLHNGVGGWFLLMALRGTASGADGWYLEITSDGVSNTVDIIFEPFWNDGANSQVIFHNPTATINVGDIFTIVVVGQTGYLFQNGIQLGSMTVAAASSVGKPILGPNTNSGGSQADIGISQFVGGSASNVSVYSVVDSRTNKPNSATSRNVNATLTYDKQTSSNAAVPPTDSRVHKPVASAVSYPQNSRTNPPFAE